MSSCVWTSARRGDALGERHRGAAPEPGRGSPQGLWRTSQPSFRTPCGATAGARRDRGRRQLRGGACRRKPLRLHPQGRHRLQGGPRDRLLAQRPDSTICSTRPCNSPRSYPPQPAPPAPTPAKTRPDPKGRPWSARFPCSASPVAGRPFPAFPVPGRPSPRFTLNPHFRLPVARALLFRPCPSPVARRPSPGFRLRQGDVTNDQGADAWRGNMQRPAAFTSPAGEPRPWPPSRARSSTPPLHPPRCPPRRRAGATRTAAPGRRPAWGPA
jgi:hypothetical protein